jgi:hypothetical protein
MSFGEKNSQSEDKKCGNEIKIVDCFKDYNIPQEQKKRGSKILIMKQGQGGVISSGYNSHQTLVFNSMPQSP